MQIILNQAEIEDALRKSILSQIALRDGQEISFDFKATRGDEGFTATIQISASKTAVEPAEEPKAKPAPKAEAKPEPKADTKDDLPVEESKEEEADADAGTKKEKPAIFNNEATSAPTQTPANNGKSLFANLTKPAKDDSKVA